MGRIKTTLVKRRGETLFKMHPDKFKDDFGENKKELANFAEIHSKKLRNVIAGYITHLSKIRKR